eukprot:21862-Prymnesium_polylepis.2
MRSRMRTGVWLRVGTRAREPAKRRKPAEVSSLRQLIATARGAGVRSSKSSRLYMYPRTEEERTDADALRVPYHYYGDVEEATSYANPDGSPKMARRLKLIRTCRCTHPDRRIHAPVPQETADVDLPQRIHIGVMAQSLGI